MHTRRFGAFLVGALLLGNALVWFFGSQSALVVERTLSTPPTQVQREFEVMGNDITRQILMFQGNQTKRRITETWEVLQLGIAGALLATAVFTTSRSITTIVCAALVMVISALLGFYITPSMSALGRAYDFLPATAALREREAFQRLDVWHRVLQIFNLLLLTIATARLLFDFYEFGAKIIPDFGKNAKKRRRRRRTAEPAAAPAAPPSEAQPNA